MNYWIYSMLTLKILTFQIKLKLKHPKFKNECIASKILMYGYTPITTETTKAVFFDYISTIKLDPIDYFAVGLENSAQKKFTSLISRPDWQEHLFKKQLIRNDPLIKAKILSQRNIIPFSEIDYVDSLGMEVMRQRRLFGIKNGLLLIHKKGALKYMVILATGASKFDHCAFLKKYYAKLGRLKHDLTKIIQRDCSKFLFN